MDEVALAVALGLAGIGAVAIWLRARRAKPPRASFSAPPELPFEDLRECPVCGMDAMTFVYEEEVDATGATLEVFRCIECGFRKELA